MKRKALAFFSKTLPILKADDTLPKVAKYEDDHIAYSPTIFNSKPTSRISFYHHRQKRATSPEEEQEPEDDLIAMESSYYPTTSDVRQPRAGNGKADRAGGGGGWCDGSEGVLCMLFNAFKGKDGGKVRSALNLNYR